MEVSFLDLKSREVVNVYDGRKLGRVIDVVFENGSGQLLGIVVPGDKKIFRRCDDIFIPLEKIKKLGSDIILVGLQFDERYRKSNFQKPASRNLKSYENYYSGLPSDVFYRPERENLNRQNSYFQNYYGNMPNGYYGKSGFYSGEMNSNSFSLAEQGFASQANFGYQNMPTQNFNQANCQGMQTPNYNQVGSQSVATQNYNQVSSQSVVNQNYNQVSGQGMPNQNFKQAVEKNARQNNRQGKTAGGSFVRLKPLNSEKYKK